MMVKEAEENYEYDDTEQRKRLKYLIGAVIVFIIAMISIIFLVIPSNTDNDNLDSSIDISNSDKKTIGDNTKDIFNKIGNFGVISDSLTADNISDVRNIILHNPNNAGDYFVSRSDAYQSISTSIMPGSPIDYDSRDVAQWDNSLEAGDLTSYSLLSTQVNVSDKGNIVEINDGNKTTVDVDVVFSSRETKRVVTGNDTNWDGSFNVLQKSFSDNKAHLTFIKDGDAWKLYNIDKVDNTFLLATWKNPSSDAFDSTQDNFNIVDKLKPSMTPSEKMKLGNK